MENFNVNRVDKEDISVLYISGFLDAHTAPELEEAIQKLIELKRFKLVINFKDLSYISSAGLGVFMGFIEQIREHSGDIKMSNMTPKIFRVFDLLGFPTLYDIVEDETLAILNFNS
jgi:anti-sigma B factor antagonist